MANKKTTMDQVVHPLAHVQNMASYPLADLSVPSGKQPVILSQNESLRAPSPHTITAVEYVISTANIYPDPDWTELRHAIGEVHELPVDQILIGAGSMELINSVMQAYSGPCNRILTTQYAYAFVRTMAEVTNAEIDIVDEEKFAVSVNNILAAVNPETSVVFVANPGNPTGTWLGRDEILRLRARLPASVLLVIDEAYGEFAVDQKTSVFDLVEYNNTIVLRTFSKAYGLAGMRVGWGVFPPTVAAQVRKLLNPNNVGIVAQAAAIAAVRDQSYMRDTVEFTAEIRRLFVNRIRTLNLRVPESETNFVLIQFPSAALARQAEESLRAEGILVRGMSGYSLTDCLRVTIGVEEHMQRVYESLKMSGKNSENQA